MRAYRVDTFQEMVFASPIASSLTESYLPADMNSPVVAGATYYVTAGAGAYTNGSFIGASDDAMNWNVLTVQYSATSPAVQAAKAALNVKIAATKRAMKRAKTVKAKKALRKRLSTLKRQLRAL